MILCNHAIWAIPQMGSRRSMEGGSCRNISVRPETHIHELELGFEMAKKRKATDQLVEITWPTEKELDWFFAMLGRRLALRQRLGKEHRVASFVQAEGKAA